MAAVSLVMAVVSLGIAADNWDKFEVGPVPGHDLPPRDYDGDCRALERFVGGACCGLPATILGLFALGMAMQK